VPELVNATDSETALLVTLWLRRVAESVGVWAWAAETALTAAMISVLSRRNPAAKGEVGIKRLSRG
jgi:hypothetical protein